MFNICCRRKVEEVEEDIDVYKGLDEKELK